MSSPLLPNSLLVAKHWLLAAVDGLDNNVATTLPDLPWTNDEFVQVMNVGGAPDIDNPRFNPVVSVNVFAIKPGSTKPPWGKAAQLGMKIIQACYAKKYAPDGQVDLALPTVAGTDGDARVVCPWHGSEFRLDDGHVVHGPATAPVPRFEARVVSGKLEARIAPTD